MKSCPLSVRAANGRNPDCSRARVAASRKHWNSEYEPKLECSRTKLIAVIDYNSSGSKVQPCEVFLPQLSDERSNTKDVPKKRQCRARYSSSTPWDRCAWYRGPVSISFFTDGSRFGAARNSPEGSFNLKVSKDVMDLIFVPCLRAGCGLVCESLRRASIEDMRGFRISCIRSGVPTKCA